MEPILTRLSIETSNRCNLRCIQCLHHGALYKGQTNGHPKEMPLDFFADILDQFYNLHSLSKYITPHFQGEPLIYSCFKDAIKLIEERQMIWNITTNGMLMTREMTDFLFDRSHFMNIAFSIDGFTSGISERIRIGINHQKLLDNISYFLDIFKKRPEVCIAVNFTKMPENQHEYKDFIKFWIDGKVLVTSSIVTDGEGLPISYYWTPSKRDPCLSPSSFTVVLTNGVVVPCCRDHFYQMIMGDLHKQSLKEVWEGLRYRRLRELHRDGKWNLYNICRKCSTWLCDYPDNFRISMVDGKILRKQYPFWESYERIE